MSPLLVKLRSSKILLLLATIVCVLDKTSSPFFPKVITKTFSLLWSFTYCVTALTILELNPPHNPRLDVIATTSVFFVGRSCVYGFGVSPEIDPLKF